VFGKFYTRAVIVIIRIEHVYFTGKRFSSPSPGPPKRFFEKKEKRGVRKRDIGQKGNGTESIREREREREEYQEKKRGFAILYCPPLKKEGQM
jgi:hypothetical protein